MNNASTSSPKDTTTVTLRFDRKTKKALDEMVAEMGMNLTTFFMVYAKRALREQRIPFDISANADPFWSENNQAQLERADAQVRTGRTVTKTLDELEAMTNA